MKFGGGCATARLLPNSRRHSPALRDLSIMGVVFLPPFAITSM
jgi:hypothetical protein